MRHAALESYSDVSPSIVHTLLNTTHSSQPIYERTFTSWELIPRDCTCRYEDRLNFAHIRLLFIVFVWFPTPFLLIPLFDSA